METMFLAAVVTTIPGLLFFLGLPAIAIALARQPGLSAWRLAAGYIGALAVLGALVAATGYVPPEEASRVWHVPPERYWAVLVRDLLNTWVAAAFMAVLGISLVGVPALVYLHHRRLATAPNLVLASAAISLVFGVLTYLAMHWSSNVRFVELVTTFLVSHAAMAAGFALAARLPWAQRLEP